MKDNFDDKLKKKWEHFHFEVDDEHRKDMILLLDQSKRRKTGLFWWLGGVATGLTIAILLIAIKQPVNDTQQPSDIPQSAHSTLPQDKAVNDTETKKDFTNDNGIDKFENTSANDNPAEIALKESNKNSFDENAVSPKKTPAKNKIQKQNQKTESPGNRGSHTQTTNQQALPAGNMMDLPDSKSDHPLASELLNKKEVVEIKPKDEKGTVTPDIIAGQHVPQGSLVPIANVVPANESLTIAVRNESYITDPLDALQIFGLEYSRSIPKAIGTSSSYRKSFALFAEAGAGLVPGMQSQFKPGWTMHGGVGVLYNTGSRNSFSLSSGYMMQNGGFEFDKTSTVQTSSFGLRSSFNSLSPDRLHFVYGRVGAHHSIRRHMVSIFGGTQYLYGAQGTITIQTQDAISGASEETSRAWLKLDGMRRWLWSAEVQYGYRITPRITLHAGMKYYLTNIEAIDPDLQSRGFYWNGKMAQVNPFFTINYQLYERI